ncbi:MAG: putative rRNA maturation factor [Arenicella sp.]|jgi:probable rRNA maturation factor
MTSSDSVLLVDVQDALEHDVDGDKPPSGSALIEWAMLAHQAVSDKPSELTLRLVDESEMIALNQDYRGKSGSTNVLSFPVDDEFGLADKDCPSLIGDIVICHKVIIREAVEQNKSMLNHYAHMVTHGVLHLHGYDHLDDQSAEEMEALEASILSTSGIENPYN